jgi:hypothetical protein
VLKVNPDNVATPIAASLGDVTTLSLLAWIADLLYKDMDKGLYTAPILIGGHSRRRRKIRLIESNAKCCYLKKLTYKGTCGRCSICLRSPPLL